MKTTTLMRSLTKSMYTKTRRLKRVLLASYGTILKSLSKKLNNVYYRGAATFGGTFVSDFIWAKYIASITGADAWVAGVWGMATVVLGAFIVLSYVGDKRMIIPAGIGAFLGTYFAV